MGSTKVFVCPPGLCFGGMKNKEVSDILNEIADYLEIQDVEFKPRAYRRAARSIDALSEDVEDIHERGELEDIDGVGDSIAAKIAEYLETGELEYYQELKEDLPIDIEALTNVEGVGPKTAKKLYESLGVTGLEDLEEAAEEGEIAEVEGFGEKTQQNILDHLELAQRGEERRLLGDAFRIADELESEFGGRDEFSDVTVVGSFRRRRPTVGDLDVLATSDSAEEAMEVFCGLDGVTEVLTHGESKSSVVLDGLQVDLRLVDESEYGAALIYFTGSKDHNITLRNRAIDRDMKLNEYGLFSGDEVVASESEEDVYGALDLSYIPPELREDTGEVEVAANNDLPELVEISDIKGDLQVHTNYSDGSNSVDEVAEKADELGYSYVLISDHGPSLGVAGGLSKEEYDEQAIEVKEANDRYGVEVLHGIEANVTEDGIDVSQEWCEDCDLVVVALHDRVDDPTERLLKVFEDYPVDILAHPSNRIINEREPLDLDYDSLMEAAGESGVAIEINSQPGRLDLDWRNTKEYRGGVEYVVSTDAHTTEEMDYMHLGVSQARRGWCEPSDILNTAGLERIRSYFNE